MILCLVTLLAFPFDVSAAAPSTIRTPLPSAVTTPSGSWVIAPMGHLGDPKNTFWELFFLAPNATRWSLVTPPGVADNGGLVVEVSPGPITVGILASQLLHYSPLAQSSDDGAQWTAVDVPVPVALAAVPDALAYQYARPGVSGRALAIVAGGRVLVAPASLASWSNLVTANALSIAAPNCGVVGVDAVALGPGSVPLVGTGCRRGGQVGVFTFSGGSWRPSGPTLGGRLSGSATRVLRLAVTGSTTTALVSATARGRSALVAMWQSAGGSWTVSAPLFVGHPAALLSTGLGASGELLVLLSSSGTQPTPVEISPGGSWSRRPPPPTGTAILAPMGDGTAEAFSVNGSVMDIFAFTPTLNRWVRVQSTVVPIAYGSS